VICHGRLSFLCSRICPFRRLTLSCPPTGIPDARPLVDGDIINLDVTLYHGGFHGDINGTCKPALSCFSRPFPVLRAKDFELDSRSRRFFSLASKLGCYRLCKGMSRRIDQTLSTWFSIPRCRKTHRNDRFETRFHDQQMLRRTWNPSVSPFHGNLRDLKLELTKSLSFLFFQVVSSFGTERSSLCW